MKSSPRRIALLALIAVSSSFSSSRGADPSDKANPHMKEILGALQKVEPKPIETLPTATARSQPSMADAVIQVIQDRGTVAPEKQPPMGKVEMKNLPGPAGNSIPVRIYTPKGEGPFPVIVYYRGGGWVIASLDTYDSSCRGLCSLNNAIVISVDYRQAPEHKFPAAPEDAYAAFQYIAEHASDFNGDGKRIAVAGESAGGNLATVVCLIAKQRGGKMPLHQVLIYPVTNYAFDTQSYRDNATAKPLNAAMMPWFFERYLNSPADGENILVSPLRATSEQLRGLPPATVVTDEIDPLRSEGIAYAEKLKAAGIDTASKDFEGVTHEFFGMSTILDQAKAANAFVAARLKVAFGK
jgi:acetyl esterase